MNIDGEITHFCRIARLPGGVQITQSLPTYDTCTTCIGQIDGVIDMFSSTESIYYGWNYLYELT